MYNVIHFPFLRKGLQMPKLISPKYSRQRIKGKTDQAFVRLGTKKHYLGAFGSPESHQKFARLVAEWSSGGKGELPKEDHKEEEITSSFE